jgi:hypothetical protein
MWMMKLLNLVPACILKHVLKWNGLALKMYFPYSTFVAMIMDSFTFKSIFLVWTLCYHYCFIVMCHGFFIFAEEFYGFNINKINFQLAHKKFNLKKPQVHLEVAF